MIIFKLRDAEDAVKGRSGYNFDGYKLRVERPKSGVASTNNGRAYTVSHGRQSYSQTRRTDHRVVVTGTAKLWLRACHAKYLGIKLELECIYTTQLKSYVFPKKMFSLC